MIAVTVCMWGIQLLYTSSNLTTDVVWPQLLIHRAGKNFFTWETLVRILAYSLLFGSLAGWLVDRQRQVQSRFARRMRGLAIIAVVLPIVLPIFGLPRGYDSVFESAYPAVVLSTMLLSIAVSGMVMGTVAMGWRWLVTSAKSHPMYNLLIVVGLSVSPVGLAIVGGIYALAYSGESLSLSAKGRPSGVDFFPEGRRVLVANADSIAVWDIFDGECVTPIDCTGADLRCVQLSSDGKYIAGCGLDGSVRLFDATTNGERRRFEGHHGGCVAVALSDDSKFLAASSGYIEYGFRLPSPLGFHTSGDGLSMAWTARKGDCGVHVWDTRDGRLLKSFLTQVPVLDVRFSADGSSVAGACSDCTVRVWDLQTAHGEKCFTGHESCVTAVTFSADGEHVISAATTFDEPALDAGENGDSPTLSTIASSWPEGPTRSRQTADKDHSLRVWDFRSGKEVRRLPGHPGGSMCLAMSSDGRCIASGGWDNTVRLWDFESGEILAAFTGHTNIITQVAFSRCGRYLVSSSVDGSVRIWRLPP
jgi:WD40 repeat protein